MHLLQVGKPPMSRDPLGTSGASSEKNAVGMWSSGSLVVVVVVVVVAAVALLLMI